VTRYGHVGASGAAIGSAAATGRPASVEYATMKTAAARHDAERKKLID
jgi:hypothetical protein